MPVYRDGLLWVLIVQINNHDLLVCHNEGWSRDQSIDGGERSEGTAIQCLRRRTVWGGTRVSYGDHLWKKGGREGGSERGNKGWRE